MQELQFRQTGVLVVLEVLHDQVLVCRLLDEVDEDKLVFDLDKGGGLPTLSACTPVLQANPPTILLHTGDEVVAMARAHRHPQGLASVLSEAIHNPLRFPVQGASALQ